MRSSSSLISQSTPLLNRLPITHRGETREDLGFTAVHSRSFERIGGGEGRVASVSSTPPPLFFYVHNVPDATCHLSQTHDRSRRSLEYAIYQRELKDVGEALEAVSLGLLVNLFVLTRD